MVIRPARATDLPALAALFRAASLAWADTRDALLAHPEALVLDDLVVGETLVAQRPDGLILGFVSIVPLGDGVGRLDHLFVAPDAWRQGIGRALLHAAIAATNGRIARVEVIANANAEPFYRSVGFEWLGNIETSFAMGYQMMLTVKETTMPHPIEFLFDVGSPTSYLAWHRLQGVAARTRAVLVPVPILLGGVFKATGGSPPGGVVAKGRWMNEDMQRWAARDGMPLAMNPFFPVNTLTMMRILAGLQGDERFKPVTNTLFAGMWQQSRNMADPEVLAATLTQAGHDAAALLELAQSPEAKQRLITNTEAAVARGVFGAPTCFVAGQMHFGQDRIDWVEAAAAAA